MPTLFPTDGAATSEEAITSFRGEHFFLSNFFPAAIRLGGIVWPTSEHAYVAAKTTDPQERQRILACRTPGEAKRAGRRLTLRPGWEDLRLEVMRAVLAQKFRHPDLARRLIATGLRPLEERNTWGDRFWGIDARSGQGENWLGWELMAIRRALQEHRAGQGDTCHTCGWARRAGAEAVVACVRPGGPREGADATGWARPPQALQATGQEDRTANPGPLQDGHLLMPCWARCPAHSPRRLTTRPPPQGRRERTEHHAREMARALHLDLAVAIRAATGQDARLEDLSGADLHTLEEHFQAALQARDAAAALAQSALTPAQQDAKWQDLLGL